MKCAALLAEGLTPSNATRAPLVCRVPSRMARGGLTLPQHRRIRSLVDEEEAALWRWLRKYDTPTAMLIGTQFRAAAPTPADPLVRALRSLVSRAPLYCVSLTQGVWNYREEFSTRCQR
jgi:hypothetical protein